MTKPKKHFYTAASPEVQPNSKYYKPAVDFELQSGLTGIAGYYAFPKGLSPADYEIYLREKYPPRQLTRYYQDTRDTRQLVKKPPRQLMRDLRKEWRALVKRNPDLARVPVKKESPFDIFSALMGAASLFNVDDIAFFAGMKRATGKDRVARLAKEEIPGYKARRDAVEAKAGVRTEWVISPRTLERMEQKLKITPLSQAFNKAAEKRAVFDRQPARCFEHHTGFRGIAGRYVFPAGMTFHDLEDQMIAADLDNGFLDRFQPIFQALLILNPDLHQINFDKDNPRRLYEVMMGVTSGFNVDDINYFTDLLARGREPAAYAMAQPKSRQLYNNIERRSAVMMEWVASPKTLRHIKAKMDRQARRRASAQTP